MEKRYLIILISSIFVINLKALEVQETKENTHELAVISPEMTLEKESYKSEMFFLKKKTNNQSKYVLIGSEAIPDSVLKMELQKLGFSTDLIINLKNINEETQRVSLLGEVKYFGYNSLLRIASLLIAVGVGAAVGNIFEKNKPVEKRDYADRSGFATFFLSDYALIRSLSFYFNKRKKYLAYFKEIKKINSNNHFVSILKVPNDSIKITIKALKKQGFQVI